jgi:large subunit ribosomal protein L5
MKKANQNGNPMREVRIAKITLNVGSGKDEGHLKRGLKLLEKITSIPPVKTKTNKRIPGWGLRPGLIIGCKVTVRKNTEELLKRLLHAKEFTLNKRCFDDQGNISFGLPEYIDIKGMDYDPELKIMGLEVAVTLERPGFRIKKRALNPKKIGKKHQIAKEEAMEFIKKFGVEIK